MQDHRGLQNMSQNGNEHTGPNPHSHLAGSQPQELHSLIAEDNVEGHEQNLSSKADMDADHYNASSSLGGKKFFAILALAANYVGKISTTAINSPFELLTTAKDRTSRDISSAQFCSSCRPSLSSTPPKARGYRSPIP